MTFGVFRSVRRLPFFKIFAIAQLALLARRHLTALSPADRRRLAELARRGRSLTPEERGELRALVSRLEPRAFAMGAADRLSPIGLRRFGLGRR